MSFFRPLIKLPKTHFPPCSYSSLCCSWITFFFFLVLPSVKWNWIAWFVAMLSSFLKIDLNSRCSALPLILNSLQQFLFDFRTLNKLLLVRRWIAWDSFIQEECYVPKSDERLFFFLLPRCAGCGILVPWPGIEPVPLEVEMWSLNHWTTRKVQDILVTLFSWKNALWGNHSVFIKQICCI